jgi:hypothetical protein
MNLAVVEISLFTWIKPFLMTFLSADFEEIVVKIPTAYSCKRIGFSNKGTL